MDYVKESLAYIDKAEGITAMKNEPYQLVEQLFLKQHDNKESFFVMDRLQFKFIWPVAVIVIAAFLMMVGIIAGLIDPKTLMI